MTNEQREAQLDQEIRSNAELADFRDLGSEITTEMVDQLHLQQDGFSLRERENAMLRTQKEIQVSRAKEELAVLKADFDKTKKSIETMEKELGGQKSNLNAIYGALQQTEKLLRLSKGDKNDKKVNEY